MANIKLTPLPEPTPIQRTSLPSSSSRTTTATNLINFASPFVSSAIKADIGAKEDFAEAEAAAATERTLGGFDRQAQNLLESLTGKQRTLTNASRIADVIDEQGELERPSSRQELERQKANPLSKRSVLASRGQELVKLQAAVKQGLISGVDFKVRAEQLFFQQMALTPGLRTELKQIITDRLGIDPAGQLAKTTLKAREDAKEQELDLSKALANKLIGFGFPIASGITSEEISNLWNLGGGALIQSKVFQMEAQTKQLTLQEKQNTQVDRSNKDLLISNLTDIIPIQLETTFNKLTLPIGEDGIARGVDLYSMSAEDIFNLSNSDKAALVSLIDKRKEEAILSIRAKGAEMRASESDISLFIDSFKSRAQRITDTISGKTLEEVSALKADHINNTVDFRIAMAQQGIFASDKQLLALAAMSKAMPGIAQQLIAKSTTALGLLKVITGASDNQNSGTGAALRTTVRRMADTSEQLTRDSTDEGFRTTFLTAQSFANTDVDKLDDVDKRSLMSLASNKDYMERLDKLEPQKAFKFRQNVARMSFALNNNFKTHIKNSVNLDGVQSGFKPLTLKPTDLHIEKDGKGEFVFALNDNIAFTLPTTEDTPAFVVRGRQEQAASELILSNQINKNPILNNTVLFRLNSFNTTEERILLDLSTEYGVSPINVVSPFTTPEEKAPAVKPQTNTSTPVASVEEQQRATAIEQFEKVKALDPTATFTDFLSASRLLPEKTDNIASP